MVISFTIQLILGCVKLIHNILNVVSDFKRDKWKFFHTYCMALDFEDFAKIGIFVLFAIILVLFIWQITVRKRKANHLIASLICGTAASYLMIMESNVLPGVIVDRYLVLCFELGIFAFQTFFFYLFLESLVSNKINPYRLSIVLIFLISHLIALYFIYGRHLILKEYEGNLVDSKLGDMFWIISDISYNAISILVYGVYGLPIYYNTFKYTKERKPIIFMVALILIVIGYSISLAGDMNSYAVNRLQFIIDLSDYAEYFKLLGLFMFIITYLLDVDYIYRLPYNIYILTVLYKNGNKIHTVRLKSERKIQIEDILLSGLISAINSVYSQTLQTQSLIESISSKDASILLKSGEFITVVIVTDKGSAVLLNALERYVKEFEKKFHALLTKQEANMTEFESAKELISAIFPFFQIESID